MNKKLFISLILLSVSSSIHAEEQKQCSYMVFDKYCLGGEFIYKSLDQKTNETGETHLLEVKPDGWLTATVYDNKIWYINRIYNKPKVGDFQKLMHKLESEFNASFQKQFRSKLDAGEGLEQEYLAYTGKGKIFALHREDRFSVEAKWASPKLYGVRYKDLDMDAAQAKLIK